MKSKFFEYLKKNYPEEINYFLGSKLINDKILASNGLPKAIMEKGRLVHYSAKNDVFNHYDGYSVIGMFWEKKENSPRLQEEDYKLLVPTTITVLVFGCLITLKLELSNTAELKTCLLINNSYYLASGIKNYIVKFRKDPSNPPIGYKMIPYMSIVNLNKPLKITLRNKGRTCKTISPIIYCYIEKGIKYYFLRCLNENLAFRLTPGGEQIVPEIEVEIIDGSKSFKVNATKSTFRPLDDKQICIGISLTFEDLK